MSKPQRSLEEIFRDQVERSDIDNKTQLIDAFEKLLNEHTKRDKIRDLLELVVYHNNDVDIVHELKKQLLLAELSPRKIN
ncbi:MAG: hypothetical protein ACRCYY_10185 [Trueperaceae bacterium]